MKRDRVSSFDLSADDRLDLARLGAILALVVGAGIVVNIIAAARFAVG